MKAAKAFVPVFVDTLGDSKTTKRFGESFGSYPVLRVHDLQGRDIAGRINTNVTAGIVSPEAVAEQMRRGLAEFKRTPGRAPLP